jgi:hypothetical protein
MAKSLPPLPETVNGLGRQEDFLYLQFAQHIDRCGVEGRQWYGERNGNRTTPERFQYRHGTLAEGLAGNGHLEHEGVAGSDVGAPLQKRVSDCQFGGEVPVDGDR